MQITKSGAPTSPAEAGMPLLASRFSLLASRRVTTAQRWSAMALMLNLLAGCGREDTAVTPQYEIVGNSSSMGNLMTSAGCHKTPLGQSSTARQAVRFASADGGFEIFDCTGVPPARIVDAVASFQLSGGSLRANQAAMSEDPGGGYGSWGLEDAPPGYTWESVNGTTTISSLHTPGEQYDLDLQNYVLGPEDALLIEIIDTWELIGDAHVIIIHITQMRLAIDPWDPYWQIHTPPPWCGECGSGGDPGSGGSGGGTPSPVSIAITGPDTVYVGVAATFFGTVTYSDASTAPGSSWYSSNPSVLRSDNGGAFTPLAAGTVTVKDSIPGLNIMSSKAVAVIEGMPAAGDDMSEEIGPNCTSPVDPIVIKWCTGDTLTVTQKSLVASAIQRIKAKGGVCDSIGQVLDSIFARNEIHTFTKGPGGDIGGGSPRGGFGDGWILLELGWLTKSPDAAHADGKYSFKRTLQSELAHEGDHLLNHYMPSNLPRNADSVHTPNQAFTVNSVRCSEFGSGG